MKNCFSLLPTVTLLILSISLRAQDVMVYTANQNWLSRIYILQMDGTVVNFHEYSFYRFVDTEIINNELYAAEAFAPRVYKVVLQTGDLQVVVDDWSLFYFYDIAYDSTYLYVTEWDLNRYDLQGNLESRASFDESVMGGAWDGQYYWTLTDSNLIKCWDLSGWPTVVEVPDSHFTPPSPDCRGLWFDGQYFWTAESKDVLGNIYQFDHSGTIVNQWLEPAFRGWAAGVISDYLTDIDPPSPAENLTFRLFPNYPNPFNPETNVRFTIPEASLVSLKIYDSLGKRVATLKNEELPAGEYEETWDAGDLPSGIYFYQLQAGQFSKTKKMLLAR